MQQVARLVCCIRARSVFKKLLWNWSFLNVWVWSTAAGGTTFRPCWSSLVFCHELKTHKIPYFDLALWIQSRITLHGHNYILYLRSKHFRIQQSMNMFMTRSHLLICVAMRKNAPLIYGVVFISASVSHEGSSYLHILDVRHGSGWW